MLGPRKMSKPIFIISWIDTTEESDQWVHSQE